jgi:hypothetical protein
MKPARIGTSMLKAVPPMASSRTPIQVRVSMPRSPGIWTPPPSPGTKMAYSVTATASAIANDRAMRMPPPTTNGIM